MYKSNLSWMNQKIHLILFTYVIYTHTLMHFDGHVLLFQMELHYIIHVE